MRKPIVAAALALVFAIGLSAQGGPDLSGRWNRETVTGPVAGGGASMWGARVEINQTAGTVTIRTDARDPERHRLDGTETAEVISVDGCKNLTRITKWQAGPDRVTVTTWIVNKGACFHGEFDDEPFVYKTGVISVEDVRGRPRQLESITDVFRNGDVLTVESTRATPGGAPASTTTTYRK